MLLKYFIKKISDENLTEIEKTSCLHYRNVKNQCIKCIETCPTSAIIKKNNSLIIEEDLCIGCGICKVNCPSQSITMNHNFGVKNILKAVEENEIVVFGCNYGKSDGNVMVPCLNGLHPELLTLLFLYFKEKKLKFNLSKCSTCTIESKAITFKNSLKNVIDFLEDIKLDPLYDIILNNNEIPQLTPKTITRRELFNIVKEGSVNHTTEIITSIWGNNKNKTLNQREILVDIVTKLSKEENFEINIDNALFSNYKVNEKCDGCNYCVAICPYNAWNVEENEETYTRCHNVGQCRSCTQCLTTCPQNAIEKASLSTDALTGYIKKIEKPIVKCKNCSTTFVMKESDKVLCSACTKREELRKSLFNKN